MARPPINPGKVDWTGENPAVYLRDVENGPYVCLASFFRVFYSPHGPGHALFLIWDSQGEHPRNGIYTDNEALAVWLREEFVAHFSSFQGNNLLAGLPLRPGSRWERQGSTAGEYSEVLNGDGQQIKLTWRALSTPFMIEVPAEKAPTGKHELFSLFLDAREAEVIVNGERGRGQAFPRDFYGHRSSTAFLAFSETWVLP
jgi:hypothetical protein